MSDKAVDCLSDLEEENLVQEVNNEVLDIFENGVDHVQEALTKSLLKNLYRIVRHPRQRPALKHLIKQTFQNDRHLFKQA